MNFLGLFTDLMVNLNIKQKEIYLESNIVYPTKEMLELIDILGRNINIMVEFINKVHDVFSFIFVN